MGDLLHLQSRPRVLIVDDDPETRVLMSSLLEEEGIDVVGTAADGATAVELTSDLAPCVVLMDIRMPGMSGIAATKTIKASGVDAQVILFTFHGETDWVDTARDAGAFCYLVKGCPPAMITEMIHRAWGHLRARQSDAG
jgi:DNA-binding NarL/FixJ family response regulator